MATVLVGDIFVGALGAATYIQMPEVFEIVYSAGTGRQCRNTDVMGGRMRIGSVKYLPRP